MRRPLFGAALVLLSGCYLHREYDRNGPGHVDLYTPPVTMVEMPVDTGRHGLLISSGALGGGGPLFRQEVGSESFGRLQLELSVDYFRTISGAAEEPDNLPPLNGINLGATLLSSHAPLERQLYAEIQHTNRLVGAAVGWTWNPVTNAHGPQATLSYGPIYARGGWLPGQAGTLEFGLALKSYAKLSWFR